MVTILGSLCAVKVGVAGGCITRLSITMFVVACELKQVLNPYDCIFQYFIAAKLVFSHTHSIKEITYLLAIIGSP